LRAIGTSRRLCLSVALFLAGFCVASFSAYILLHDGGATGRCAQDALFPLPPHADYIDNSVTGAFQIFPLQVRCGMQFTDGSSGVDVITDWTGTWVAFGFFAAGLAVWVHGVAASRRKR